MNSNWKTPEEANKNKCMGGGAGRNLLTAINCISNDCGHWLWSPCPMCCNGSEVNWDKNRVSVCKLCGGTDHDGSGRGRCGLINM